MATYGLFNHLAPYRVEWRVKSTWLWVNSCESHDEALALAAGVQERDGGHTRVISQHVIAKYPQ